MYRSCKRGPCPCSYTLGTGWHSPPAGTALGSAAPSWDWMQCLVTSPWQLQRLPEASGETPGQPKHAASLLSGSQAGNRLVLFRRSVHLGIPALSGGASLPSSVSAFVAPGPFHLGPYSALLKRPRPHGSFLWLEVRNGGERTVPTSLSVPGGGAREGTGSFDELLWVKTLNTHFEAAECQLVLVAGTVPRTGEGCLCLAS